MSRIRFQRCACGILAAAAFLAAGCTTLRSVAPKSSITQPRPAAPPISGIEDLPSPATPADLRADSTVEPVKYTPRRNRSEGAPALMLPVPGDSESVSSTDDAETSPAIVATPALTVDPGPAVAEDESDDSHDVVSSTVVARRRGLIDRVHCAKPSHKGNKEAYKASGVIKTKDQKKRGDIGYNNSAFPRELRMRSHPLYVVEPPDVLYIETFEALPGRPIAGERLVRQDGTISLGYYGQIHVAGLTLAEIEQKIRDRLSDHLQDPQVYVDVAAFNSKVYYVLGQVQQTGRLPITGKETVLDAITLAGGLTPYARIKELHVARPNPGGGCDQILHVDWHAISSCGDTRTNYQLLPGDRIMVPGTKGFLASVFLENFLTPVERVAHMFALVRFATE